MALRTSLYELHASSGATFIEFGGWEMPLQFDGIMSEHLAVRAGAGLFDVSHMGKILISGPGARQSLDRLSANGVPQRPWGARYTHLLDEDGGIIDDVIITCLAVDLFFLVCNAGPRERVLQWLRKHMPGDVEDRTFSHLCLALQGPKAARVMQLLTQRDVATLRPFTGAFMDLLLGERLGTRRTLGSSPVETVGRVPLAVPDAPIEDFCLVTRTGYTGEDGFELFPPKELGVAMWNAALAAGQEAGIRPVGLGARDTLRLEKGYLLSGTDFDGGQTPLECGSERFVKWDHDFLGREALRKQRDQGDHDRLVGILVRDRGIPRHGCEVMHGGRRVGTVTSGTMSPSLRAGIALARLRPEAAAAGTSVDVVVRERPLPAVVKLPPFL